MDETQLSLKEAKRALKALAELKTHEGFQIFQSELRAKFNALYYESLRDDLSDNESRRKLERHKGVAYAISLLDDLIGFYEDEIEQSERTENG